MAGEKKIEKAEPISTVLTADSVTGLSEQGVVSGKDRITSDSTSAMSTLLDATSTIKGEIDQDSVGEHGVYYPPTSCYNYYYPGYNGSFPQMDDHGYLHANGSHTGVQSENGSSMVYYLPGYNPYAPGTLMGLDGQGVGQQQYFPNSGYMQPPNSYGSEAAPCYSWDTTFVGDVSTVGNAGFGNVKARPGSTALSRSGGFISTKTNGNLASKFTKSLPQAQPLKSLNQVPHLGNDFSAGLLKGYPAAGRFSSFSNQKYGLFPPNGHSSYKANGRTLNGNDRFKPRDKYNRNEDFESSTELTRGPRSRNKNSSDSPIEKEDLPITIRRDQYNLPDFQTEYENAKFYVIKSYSEDDVHKSVKYNVWASTPNGNKKLDAAFRDAESKLKETAKQCPIFLFFSVNGSGQFVGLAEMIGEVDFDKDMDFWQVDKWSGFFPVKWHVIKDIPNTQLRHIILENNDNRPVTFTRDTQEIGLKQGVEMLNILKSYAAKTSLLDDFTFYESREKSLQAKRGSKPATLKMETYDEDDINNHLNGGRNIDVDSAGMRMGSLISLTKNMSLNGYDE